jgi:hypothetical protein
LGDKTKVKKPHKLLKLLLGLVIVFVVLCAALAVWQRENIAAVIKASRCSSAEIAEEISASKANTQKEIEKYDIPIKRDFTLEEEEALRNGTMSVDEAVSLLFEQSDSSESGAQSSTSGDTQANGESDVESKSNNGSTDTQAQEKELTPEQQIVTDGLTQMYTLKAYYLGELGAFEKDLKAQYKQKYGNQKSAGAIADVVQSNMTDVAAMESECDKKVDMVLSDMRERLEAIGASTDIVSVVEDSYVNEKALRKSYYLSLYN